MRALIYSRISSDPQHDELGVKRHLKACRELCAHNGWTVVVELIDNDISATKGVPRAGYARALVMVGAGEVDVIVVAATSRLWRNRRERAEGIEMLATARVGVVPVKGAPLELASASGRFLAGVLGEADTWESEVKAERNRDKADELAAAGKIGNGGPRPFGYSRIYAGEGNRRKILRDELHPVEAPIVADLAARCLAGESIYFLVKSLHQQGIISSSGRPWSQQALRYLLSCARIAGLREHKGVVVAEAVWPPIITPEQHRDLRARLRHQKAPTGVKVRKHAMTGLVVCARCHAAGRRGVMSVSSRRGQLIYMCKQPGEGGCSGTAQRLDVLTEQVDAWVIDKLNDPNFLAALHARLAAREEGPPRLVLERVEAAERRLAALRAQLVEGDVDTIAVVTSAIREVTAQLAEDRESLRHYAEQEPLAGLDFAKIARTWRTDVDMRTQMTVLGALIDRIAIGPARRMGIRRGEVDLDRIDVVPLVRSDPAA